MTTVAETLYFLCCVTNHREFRNEIVSAKFPLTGALVPTQLLSYLVPQHMVFVATRLCLATVPPVDDPSLTPGDWRSSFFDASGTAQLWIEVNGQPKTPINASYFALLNRPFILLFNGGETLTVKVQRFAGDAPPTENVLIALEGFLAPARVYDALSRFETTIIASYA